MLNFFSEYPQGYDLTILQTIYLKAEKDSRGKWTDPTLILIAKDNEKCIKIKTEIEDPDYEYFLANEPDKISYHHNNISLDVVHPIVCKHRSLLKDIAKETNNIEFYNSNIGSNYSEIKKLHTLNQIFMSDMDIEDHYRFWFDRKYQNTYKPATIGFLDIEVDVIDIAGDFPEPGEAPISVVTYIFKDIVHTYIFREPANPLIAKFEEDFKAGKLESDLRDTIVQGIGGKEKADKFNVDKYKFDIKFYDEEIELIGAIFEDINKEQPDFVLAWNMSFDIPYIIARCERLGYNPADIMCHPDFKHKHASYYIDHRADVDLAERGDHATISSYSVFLDQMITFKSRRKGQSEYPSYSLDYIGGAICGAHKLDYHHITLNLVELPYIDFKTYVFYNIVDVIVQVCIEKEVDDIGYVYSSAIENNTRYAKIHRQTVYLFNRQAKFYYENGFVIGNNVNVFKKHSKEKFPGAYVADPLLASDRSKMVINGKPSMLFNNIVDFDFSALYPSMIREFNLNPETQIGKLFFTEETVKDNEESESIREAGEIGSNFIKDYVTDDYLKFCHEWLSLPSYEEMYDFIDTVMSSGKITPKYEFMKYKKGVLVKPEEQTSYSEVLPGLITGTDKATNGIIVEMPR